MCNDININSSSSSSDNEMADKYTTPSIYIMEIKTATYEQDDMRPEAEYMYEFNFQTKVCSTMLTITSLEELKMITAAFNDFLARHTTKEQPKQ